MEGEIAPIIHAIITINIIKGNKVSLNPKKTGQNERDWGVGLLGSPPPPLTQIVVKLKANFLGSKYIVFKKFKQFDFNCLN